MKKLILTAAAAMMVLASCTKTTVESIDGPQEITFRKIDGAMTKTASEYVALPTTTDLGVFAYINGGNQYFGNTQFTHDNTQSVWHNTEKYWPLQEKLDFVVYSPYISNTSDDQISYDKSDKKLIFTIANNTPSGSPATQKDYLYGQEYFNNAPGEGGSGYDKTSNNVAINLEHALAKITIKLKANKASIFNVSDFTLEDTHQAGTITVVYRTDDLVKSIEGVEAATPIKYDFNMITPSTSSDITENFEDHTYSIYVLPNTAATELNITYTILSSTATLSANVDLTGTWFAGKHYIYELTLTATEILLSPKYDHDWDSNEETLTPTI